MKRIPISAIVVLVIGIAFCVVGPTVFSLLPNFVSKKINETFVLNNDTEPFKIWEEIPVPIYMKFFIFNVTNPDDVVSTQQTPIVEEIGPFVFREKRKKEILEFYNEGSENETVSYLDMKYYYFEPELSAHSLDLNLTVINVPLASVAAIVKQIASTMPDSEFLFMAVDEMIEHNQETMFTTKTAGQLLFEGYKEPLVEELMKAAKDVLHINIPEIIPNNTFGLFYGRNESADGVYEVFTGKKDTSKYATIHTWNNTDILPYWKEKRCNMINGTDGFQYPPFVTKDRQLYLFITDICRSLYLTYEQDMYVKGIEAYKFVIPPVILQSPKKYPENMCYCLEPKFESFSGVIEISPCQHGAPIVLSFPHFYQASPCIQFLIDGLKPEKNKHENYVTVEPTTGLVIQAARRLQLNVHLTAMPEIPTYQRIIMNMTDAIFPIAWLEESATLDEPTTNMLKSMLTTPVLLAKSISVALNVLGVLLIVLFVSSFVILKNEIVH